jgi:hypothetical protein
VLAEEPAAELTELVALSETELPVSVTFSFTAFLALLASPFKLPNCALALLLSANIATSAITDILIGCFMFKFVQYLQLN